jgi:glycosyltransferase involved in cell wall biosynthesis
MLISIVVDSLYHARAGTERQLTLLAPLLARRHRVEIIVLRRSDWLVANASRLGVSAVHTPFAGLRDPANYSGLWHLWRHLRTSKPDIVHTFMPVANVFGICAARLAAVPVVISSRRDYGEWMTPLYLRATRFANRFADHIITNSRRVKDLTVRREGVSSDKISVITNGMDLSRFLAIRRDRSVAIRHGISPHATLVGVVANFRPMKRHDTIIEAARILSTANENFVFVLIGMNAVAEDLLGKYRARVRQLGLDSRVLFLNDIENVEAWLAAIDIGVNASEGEGLSNAVMEYMAAGVVCVAADSGGNPDLIDNEENGLLFPVGSAPALAETLIRIRRNPALASRMASAARLRASSEFALDRMAAAMESCYVSLLARKQATEPDSVRIQSRN